MPRIWAASSRQVCRHAVSVSARLAPPLLHPFCLQLHAVGGMDNGPDSVRPATKLLRFSGTLRLFHEILTKEPLSDSCPVEACCCSHSSCHSCSQTSRTAERPQVSSTTQLPVQTRDDVVHCCCLRLQKIQQQALRHDHMLKKARPVQTRDDILHCCCLRLQELQRVLRHDTTVPFADA